MSRIRCPKCGAIMIKRHHSGKLGRSFTRYECPTEDCPVIYIKVTHKRGGMHNKVAFKGIRLDPTLLKEWKNNG